MAASCVLERVGRVAVLRMVKGENRINYEFMRNITELLEDAEKNVAIKALVTTGQDKFYSNGLDLPEMMNSTDGGQNFLRSFQKVLNKILVFPKPTIAAINGHVYAAGAMMALTHDYRIMRNDRGWFCLPEVHLKIPFTVGMISLLKAKLPESQHVDAIVMGKRYNGLETKDAGIVHQLLSESELLDRAIAFGEELASKEYNDAIFCQIKSDLYHFVTKDLISGPLNFSEL